ncbi:MAG: dicarboxylate/amino acid:cation symporter, partial [Myxococcales bacterium]|nr:dicarboxylate/amino acid:cation symporter [Myxococcales bacterium]
MQIYTKVLIGMAVGAAIGIFLGPNSEFLEHDTYAIRNASTVEVRRDHRFESTAVALPKTPVNFKVLETKYEDRTDARGQVTKAPAWAKVRFKYSKAIAIHDQDGAIRASFDNPRLGSHVEAWLRITTTELPSGGFASFPTPISGLGHTITTWLRPIGTAFMRLIQMVIVPLVFASLLVGVASLGDVRKLGRLGGKTLLLYTATTAVAVSIGLTVAHLFRPGRFIGESHRAILQAQFAGDASSKADNAANAPSAIDNILNIIPTNPVASLASGDMLQIIFFALVFGIALTLLKGDDAVPVITFFDRVQDAMVLVIHMVMAVAPYGVAALVADVVGQSGISVLSALLVYSLAVLAGLTIHAVLVYGALVRVFAKLPFLQFLKAIRPAQLIAFSTSSSSATLPVSMECAEENLNISNPVASFVIPLGATVNMDGTALYQGVAAIFIAQVFGIELSLTDQLVIVGTATMASIGAAGVPGAGMVTLALVLTATGIPSVGIALILGMDRLLDM